MCEFIYDLRVATGCEAMMRDEILLFELNSEVPKPKNWFTFEVLVNGKPDGKIAVSGRRVRVRYTGRLQKNGKIFDDKFIKRNIFPEKEKHMLPRFQEQGHDDIRKP
ncbi:hypothetical protein YC2023_042205 [Brassica napus]